MRILLDTHAVIWYVDQDHLLGPSAHAAISDPANDLLLSAGTIWEVGIKVGLNKLSLSLPYRDWMKKGYSGPWAVGVANLCGICRCASRTSETSW